MSKILRDIAILKTKNADYCCLITGIAKVKLKSIAKYWFDWKKWNIIKIKYQ